MSVRCGRSGSHADTVHQPTPGSVPGICVAGEYFEISSTPSGGWHATNGLACRSVPQVRSEPNPDLAEKCQAARAEPGTTSPVALLTARSIGHTHAGAPPGHLQPQSHHALRSGRPPGAGAPSSSMSQPSGAFVFDHGQGRPSIAQRDGPHPSFTVRWFRRLRAATCTSGRKEPVPLSPPPNGSHRQSDRPGYGSMCPTAAPPGRRTGNGSGNASGRFGSAAHPGDVIRERFPQRRDRSELRRGQLVRVTSPLERCQQAGRIAVEQSPTSGAARDFA